MIEIYLAVLLFGLGSIYNNSNSKLSKNEIENEIENENEDNVYKQNNTKLIKEMENKYAKELDKKCKTILPRDFSSLIDNKSKKIYKNRKLGESEHNPNVDTEILKYIPKNNQSIKSSLTGQDMPIEQFITSKTIGKENFDDVSVNTWAIPHFKSTATQNMKVDSFQNKLEMHTGRNQFDFHKKETKNFFKPNKDVSWVNGTPNVIDKLEKRFVKSNNRQSERPFEQIKVAPAVGKNYGSEGSGGFHQYDIQDIVKPKNIDELRVKTNPKISYSEPVQSGKRIDKRQAQSEVFKHRPDKIRIITSNDDLLKTTGANLKAKAKENFNNKATNRSISKEIVGGASPVENIAHSKRAAVKESIKNNYKNHGPSNLVKKDAWSIKNQNNVEEFQSNIESDFDISNYGKDAIKLPPNERDTTQNKTIVSNVVDAVKSIIAPLQDKMKRTKKENIEGNPNIHGYVGADLPSKQTTYDPNDIARTTIKETTEDNEHTGNINGPDKLTVYDPNDIAKTTIKETTENNEYNGNINGPEKLTVYDPNDVARTTIKETTSINKIQPSVKGAIKLTVYDPNDVAKTTIKETLIHDVRAGNIDIERNKKQMDYNFEAPKTTLKETTIDNVHNTNVSYVRGDGKGYLSNDFFAPSTLKQLTSNKQYAGNLSSSQNNKGGYLSNRYDAPATQKQSTSDNEYTGSANSSSKALTDLTASRNMNTNGVREESLRGRSFTQQGAKSVPSSQEQGNVAINKQNVSINLANTIRISASGQQQYRPLENTQTRVSLSSRPQNELYKPYNLNQLNNNPLAISINRPAVNEGFVGSQNEIDTDLEDSDTI